MDIADPFGPCKRHLDSEEDGGTVAPIAVDDSFVPLIDPDSDVRVWATLEEGCNAACHSVGWCEKEQTYFDDYGFTTRYLEAQNPKVITGRGGHTVTALGRRRTPFALLR